MSRNSSVSRADAEKFVAGFREHVAKRYREIDRLGVPPWENEAEVARIAHARTVIRYDYNMFYRRPPGFPRGAGTELGRYLDAIAASQFVFHPIILRDEEEPDPTDDELRWLDFLVALTSGHKKEVADLASKISEVKKWMYHPPPWIVFRIVFLSMLNFLSGEIKARSGSKVPSRVRNAVEYSKLLLAELRDMFPTQKYREHKVKANDLRRRAKQIAAAKYKLKVADLDHLTYREKKRRR
jgi:hypothetical protein